jgi:aryl-alcohol dehydrogenase-like predicted oxidoreductase
MNYRVLGKTHLSVSEIGFGAWGIGGPAMAGSTPIGWGNSHPETSRRAVERAIDVGITLFDTADFYGIGKSEELLGEVLGKRWGNLIVATKVGHTLAEDGSIRLNYTRDHILKACEASLRRLHKEVLDVYQLHSARVEDLEQGECIEAMERLKEQGKIRFWGLSLSTYEPDREGLWMIQHNVGDTLQLVLNIFNQRALKNVIPEAAQMGYGIIARMPLQFGLLAGKFTPDTRFDPADHRSMRLPPHLLRKGIDHLGLFKNLVDRQDIPLDTFALKFVLAHQKISTIIPGIKTPEQADRNATASNGPSFPEQDIDFLYTLFQEHYDAFLDELRTAG